MIKRSFPPVVDAGTRLLILGSLPGEASLAVSRYYAHPRNAFWRLLSEVLGADIARLDYDARLATLLARHVGLWDVVAGATRRGSMDDAIRDAEANDLPSLVATLPHLRALAFNGKTAAKIGRRAIGATRLTLIDLPSSSPAFTLPLAEKTAGWLPLAAVLT